MDHVALLSLCCNINSNVEKLFNKLVSLGNSESATVRNFNLHDRHYAVAALMFHQSQY